MQYQNEAYTENRHVFNFSWLYYSQDFTQRSFNGSNTDGPFTTAISNSFLSLLKKP